MKTNRTRISSLTCPQRHKFKRSQGMSWLFWREKLYIHFMCIYGAIQLNPTNRQGSSPMAAQIELNCPVCTAIVVLVVVSICRRSSGDIVPVRREPIKRFVLLFTAEKINVYGSTKVSRIVFPRSFFLSSYIYYSSG